jgi:hypothetical protein
LGLSILGIFTQNPDQFEKSRFGIFIKILSSLAFILVAMGLILTSQALEESRKLTSVDQTLKLIDRALLQPISSMQKFYPNCPNFVKSLWPQKGIFDASSIDTDHIKDDPVSILNLSMIIFQSFEDHFTGSGFDETGEIVWTGNFLQWTSSDTLQEMWNTLYPNFKSSTSEYAKLLFEYSNKNGKIKDSAPLKRSKRSTELIKDQRLIKLFNIS